MVFLPIPSTCWDYVATLCVNNTNRVQWKFDPTFHGSFCRMDVLHLSKDIDTSAWIPESLQPELCANSPEKCFSDSLLSHEVISVCLFIQPPVQWRLNVRRSHSIELNEWPGKVTDWFDFYFQHTYHSYTKRKKKGLRHVRKGVGRSKHLFFIPTPYFCQISQIQLYSAFKSIQLYYTSTKEYMMPIDTYFLPTCIINGVKLGCL